MKTFTMWTCPEEHVGIEPLNADTRLERMQDWCDICYHMTDGSCSGPVWSAVTVEQFASQDKKFLEFVDDIIGE